MTRGAAAIVLLIAGLSLVGATWVTDSNFLLIKIRKNDGTVEQFYYNWEAPRLLDILDEVDGGGDVNTIETFQDVQRWVRTHYDGPPNSPDRARMIFYFNPVPLPGFCGTTRLAQEEVPSSKTMPSKSLRAKNPPSKDLQAKAIPTTMRGNGCSTACATAYTELTTANEIEHQRQHARCCAERCKVNCSGAGLWSKCITKYMNLLRR